MSQSEADARDLTDRVAAAAGQSGFSGSVRVDRGTDFVMEAAFGYADRAHRIDNTIGTRFAMASGSKAFTALAALSLAAEGALDLDGSVRTLLGDDLPSVSDQVSVRHLLSHTSGVGEYLDDDADPAEYLLPGSMHTYTDPETLLPVLDHPMASAPGTFAYSNAGFVLLGLLVQRAAGQRYQDVVRRRVLTPAGLQQTDFLRSDELPGDAAVGYLWPDRLRTNVFHLPIEGSADGGAYTTTADLVTFWRALAAGRIIPETLVVEATSPGRGHDLEEPYGLGFWLPRGCWQLVGQDAGVSMATEYDPGRSLVWSVLSNDSDGAWPVVAAIRSWLADSAGSPGA